MKELCGHWMPRAKTTCGRTAGHGGEHRSTECLAAKAKRQRNYHQENREERLESQRDYYQENHESVRESQWGYYQANQDSIAERQHNYRQELHAQVLAIYGTECSCCGSTEDLQIDHILGGGRKHKESLGGGWPLYVWLRDNEPMGFQVLCATCNVSKRDGTHCKTHDKDLTEFPILCGLARPSK